MPGDRDRYLTDGQAVDSCLERLRQEHGLPYVLRTGNRPEFLSDEFVGWEEKNKSACCLTISNRANRTRTPTSNGSIERTGRSAATLSLSQPERGSRDHVLTGERLQRAAPARLTGQSDTRRSHSTLLRRKLYFQHSTERLTHAELELFLDQTNGCRRNAINNLCELAEQILRRMAQYRWQHGRRVAGASPHRRSHAHADTSLRRLDKEPGGFQSSAD